MWPKFLFFVTVFLFYTGFSLARRGNREIFGECKEEQNFRFCADLGTMADSGTLYSFNAERGKCEIVFGMCSTATANVFSSKKKCKRFCGAVKKGCHVRGKWYKHKSWIKSEGCCMCIDGLVSCSSCTESNGFCEFCSRFNRPNIQKQICRYGEECYGDDDEDCRCKNREEYCEEQCERCEDDGDDDVCPDECDCETDDEASRLFEQLSLEPMVY